MVKISRAGCGSDKESRGFHLEPVCDFSSFIRKSPLLPYLRAIAPAHTEMMMVEDG